MSKLDFEQRQRANELVDRIGDDLEEYAFQIVFLEAENERLRADLDAEKERSQELGQDKENWYRICELHATRLDSYQKAMRQAMSMLDQAEPRPEAAFSTLLLALNPDLESAKSLAAKEDE